MSEYKKKVFQVTKFNFPIVITYVCIVFFTLLFAGWQIYAQERTMRYELLKQAQLVADSVCFDCLQGVGNLDGVVRTEYFHNIRMHLSQLMASGDKYQQLSVLGRTEEGSVFFCVRVDADQHAEEHEFEFGEIYEDASEELHSLFVQGKPFIEEHVHDGSRLFVSALVPISDPDTGEVRMVLAMEVDMAIWRWQIHKSVLMPLSVLVMLFILGGIGLSLTYTQVAPLSKPIYARLLVPISLSFLLLVILFVGIAIQANRQRMHKDTMHVYEVVVHDFDETLAQQEQIVRMASDIVVCNHLFSGVYEALKTHNKETLVHKYAQVFTSVAKSYAISRFSFYGADSRAIVSVDDSVEKETRRHGLIAQAVQTGNTVSGLEITTSGTAVLYVVAPIYEGNTIVGYLELGKEMGDVFTHLCEKYNVEILVSVNKNVVKQELWERAMARRSRRVSWNSFPDEVLIYDSLCAYNPPFDMSIFARKDYVRNIMVGEITLDSASYAVIRKPITNGYGSEVGNLMIMQDMAVYQMLFKRDVGKITLMGITILGVLFSLLHILLSRTDSGIRAHHSEMEHARESLYATNQQLLASEQQLQALNQQLMANEQQLRAMNQQLMATEQQLRAMNQQLLANTEQLMGSEARLKRSEEELKSKIEHMERINDVMIQREVNVIAIKREVNALCQELGRAPRYTEGLTEVEGYDAE